MKKDRWTIKQIKKMKKEPPTSQDPTIPYRRTIVKTKQWWFFELIRQGQTKILLQYITIWGIILILIGTILYLAIMVILGWLRW